MRRLFHLPSLLLSSLPGSSALPGSSDLPYEAVARIVRKDGLSKCDGSSFKTPELFGIEVLSVVAAPLYNYTFIDYVPGVPFTARPLCNVNVTYTHPGANDTITVMNFLPLEGWNQRFLGLSGGGFSSFSPGAAEHSAAFRAGYAAAGTTGGHDPSNSISPAGWALHSPGNVNYELLVDFATRSLDELPKIAKQIVTDYYGSPPLYSYFSGCSGGGRQGVVSAQRYPENYDGILAIAPAVHWSEFFAGMLYPQIVMLEEGYLPSPCEFDAFASASIDACDIIDGVIDGVVGNPDLCNFDPHSIVGTTVNCTDGPITITSKSADVVAKVWQGPVSVDGSFLWYPYDIGSQLSLMGNTSANSDGSRSLAPSELPLSWYQYYVEKYPSFDITTLNYSRFAERVHESIQQYGSIIDATENDLRSFQKAGGKMITWHGTLDQWIPKKGLLRFYEDVKEVSPDVTDFYRVFLAPGVGHCRPNPGGVGYIPNAALATLAAWVEEGVAPTVLAAVSLRNGWEQPVCQYPKVAKWDGVNNVTLATSYTCADQY